tara:strand:- start:290 stop:505 length:216 start_codon:yes stop_codon:yes gene_type:complete
VDLAVELEEIVEQVVQELLVKVMLVDQQQDPLVKQDLVVVELELLVEREVQVQTQEQVEQEVLPHHYHHVH